MSARRLRDGAAPGRLSDAAAARRTDRNRARSCEATPASARPRLWNFATVTVHAAAMRMALQETRSMEAAVANSTPMKFGEMRPEPECAAEAALHSCALSEKTEIEAVPGNGARARPFARGRCVRAGLVSQPMRQPRRRRCRIRVARHRGRSTASLMPRGPRVGAR